MRSLLLAAVLSLVPGLSTASPITLEFTGTVIVYDDTAVPGDDTGSLSHLNASGTFIWDTSLGPALSFAADPGGDWYQSTQESSGTPYVEFVSASVTWANGSFSSAPTPVPPGALEFGDNVSLTNWTNGNSDLFVLSDLFQWEGTDQEFGANGIVLNWASHFINTAGLPTGTELPDFAAGFGIVGLFNNYTTDAAGVAAGGSLAAIRIDSARLRSVPEPSVWVLLLAGLGAFGFTRRKTLSA